MGSNLTFENCSTTRQPVTIMNMQTSQLVCRSKSCLSTSHPSAKSLYEAIESVSTFFSQTFGLCGIDGKGKLPTFNIEWNVSNAAWSCSESSGCSWKFNNKFITSPIVCHEMTHAVIHEFTRLSYAKESGALNESLADVMAIAYKRFTGDATWSILDRDMSIHLDLGSYQTEQVCSTHNDNCYVHSNSKIPSHAFYTATVLSGNFDKIVKVWFQAMLNMKSNESFQDFARRTVVISEAYKVKTVVKKAWLDVGIFT